MGVQWVIALVLLDKVHLLAVAHHVADSRPQRVAAMTLKTGETGQHAWMAGVLRVCV